MSTTPQPIGNQVLTTIPEENLVTKSGITLINEQRPNAPRKADVVAVGSGYRCNGEIIPLTVKVGDTVLVEKQGGMAFKYEDVIYFVFSEDQIIGILEK